ncbi:adenosine deaminase [Saccharibacillus sacchari]|uniref:Adenosine deaminase n=1 Tax=Saccharibacillus sacchari TaxID=456493 RepID=A0ACC6PH19_9BACL
MNKFKITKSVFAGVLISTSIMLPVSAQTQENETSSLLISEMGQTDLASLVKSQTEDSITFTDNSTLIQYDDYYIAKDAEGQEFKITKVDENTVEYENLKTGEVDYVYKDSESVSEDLGFSAKAEIASNGFEYQGATQHSTEIQYATVALIAGALAMWIPGPVGKVVGAITLAAGYYKSVGAPRAYWIEKTYTKTEQVSDFMVHYITRKDYHYYKYHDYTSFLHTVSTSKTCMPYGCGAPIVLN